MAIKLNSLQCPECKAALNYEEGRTKLFCSYCGAQILLTNENEHIYRQVNDAEIKRAETEQLLKLKQLELKERTIEKSRKGRKTAYIIAATLAALGALLSSADSDSIAPLLGLLLIAIALWIGLLTYTSADKSDRHARILSPDEVRISKKMKNYNEIDYDVVQELYRNAGFQNVNAVPLRDIGFFSNYQNRKIESIIINGDEDFKEGDIFPKSSSVTITYHSPK